MPERNIKCSFLISQLFSFSVLKSDNANGLFMFETGQSLARTVSESVGNMSFRVERTLGFLGTVDVSWRIFKENGSFASDDFVHSSGLLTFVDNEKVKVKTFITFVVLVCVFISLAILQYNLYNLLLTIYSFLKVIFRIVYFV